MGDSENTLPPSKKRAAGRELSRDNPGLDDEEEVPGQETGTFKRASEEVLANRRIVKVRRSQSQTQSTPSAPSNPFAAIRLVPPTVSTPTPEPVNNNIQEIEKTASEKVESPSSVNKETEKGTDDNDDKPLVSETESKGNDENNSGTDAEEAKGDDSEVKKETESKGNDENNSGTDAEEAKGDDSEVKKDAESKGNDENTPGADAEEAKGDDSEAKKDAESKENDENTPGAKSVNSFQQLSSSQNAFTGLVGTGFSSSTFSFGSIPKLDQPTFPSFSFGTNGNSSLFGNPPEKTEGSKIPSMQEVQVETGEENEKAVFTADSALFEFLDGGWKERGKGELKVNESTTGTKKARLVMRARGNYRLILNASIFPDMKLTNMEKKGVTFACLNSTGEGKDGLSTFALKFKDASIVEDFRSVVTAYKGNNTTAAAAPTLKTPENSPKASDE